MRLLDRYLLRELLIPLSYCLGGFLLFWIAFDLFAELNRFRARGLLPAEIAEYYLVVAPEFLILVLPIALLLALLYALTNHARHHEITAIRAAGISLWRLLLPYFFVGLVISVAALLINELWVPRSSDAAEEILERHATKEAGLGRNQVRLLSFTNSRDGRLWQVGLYDHETTEMIQPKVFWTETNGTRVAFEAERALHTNGVWTFFNASQYETLPETNAIPIPLFQRTNEIAMPQFGETPELVKSEIKVSRSLSLARAKRTDLAISEILNYLRLHPNPPASDRAWLHTKLQGRFAAPWTCFVVVLIAAPFGAASGRRNVFVGVASSIVICFGYFVLQQLSLALGTGGYLPPWLAAWLPNLTFGLVGLVLTSRVR